MDKDVRPSDPSWAAIHAPFTFSEAESHPGRWVVRDCNGVPLMEGENKLAAQLMTDTWNEEAARWWMLAP
jgi:hypothetical protein